MIRPLLVFCALLLEACGDALVIYLQALRREA